MSKKPHIYPVPDDPNQPIEPEYRGRKVEATDDKGHSARMQFRLPAVMVRACKVLVLSGKFVYETESDLLRDALHDKINQLHEIEPKLIKNFSALEACLQTVRAEKEAAEVDDFIGELARTVAFIEERGGAVEVQKLVNKTYARFQGDSEIKDSWKARVMKRMNTLFPKYLKIAIETISMAPSDFSEEEEGAVKEP